MDQDTRATAATPARQASEPVSAPKAQHPRPRLVDNTRSWSQPACSLYIEEGPNIPKKMRIRFVKACMALIEVNLHDLAPSISSPVVEEGGWSPPVKEIVDEIRVGKRFALLVENSAFFELPIKRRLKLVKDLMALLKVKLDDLASPN